MMSKRSGARFSWLIKGIALFGMLPNALGQATPVPAGGLPPHPRYLAAVFEKVDVREDIVFKTLPPGAGRVAELRVDIYLPAGDQEDSRPAILWIHGGGFRPGNDKKQKYIVRMATEFARRGYVCFSADYRVREQPQLDRQGTLNDALDDCRAALAWIRNNASPYGIDADRLAVGGGSAGGMIACNLVARENSEASRAGRKGIVALVNLWGSPDSTLRPAEVDRSFPPTVIVHGTADQTVPYEQSEQLAAMLKVKGVRCLLHPIPGALHTPSDHLDSIVEVTAKFLFSVLFSGL